MIKIVKGDLLRAKEDMICHQVNCQGKMNSGIAKSIRDKHPFVYESYLNMIDQYQIDGIDKRHLLGKIWGVNVSGSSYSLVVNMFGQLKYGYDGKQYTDTSALYTCFKSVRAVAEKYNLSVALPYMIGSYRGGADWKEVEGLLLTAFDGYEATLYKFHNG